MAFRGRVSTDTVEFAERARDYLRTAYDDGELDPEEEATLSSLIDATVTSAAITDSAVMRSQRMLRRGVELPPAA